MSEYSHSLSNFIYSNIPHKNVFKQLVDKAIYAACFEKKPHRYKMSKAWTIVTTADKMIS